VSAGLRGSIPPIHLILEAKLEEGADHEENISAESHEATPEARFQRANEDARGSGDHQAATGQGAQAPGRVRGVQVVVGGRTGRFRRPDRLLRSLDYRRVSKQGRRIASREFVVLIAPITENGLLGPPDAAPRRRIGITASRKVGNAVVRNRLKRSVREWFRRSRDTLSSDLDLVVIARKPAASLDPNGVAEVLSELLTSADVSSNPT
jgi:ribonuclease P protein component